MTLEKLIRDLDLEKDVPPDHFGQWLGYEVVDHSREHSSVDTKLLLRDDHLSPAGYVHGGVVAAFLDFTCGCAVFTSLAKGELCSTVEIKVNYFRPLRVGDKLAGKARVVFRGNKLASVVADLLREGSSDPVGMATGTFNIYRKKLKN